jgi:hypothetical protein
MLMSKVIRMKHYLNKILLISCSGLLLLTACNKETKVTYTGGGTAPVLTASLADSIPLPVTDTTANAVTFNWTSPNYTFSDGPSSLNVTYYLEFDTVGANFSSPKMQTVAISSTLTTTMTISVLNSLLANGLGLSTGASHNVQVRIESFISPYTSGSAPIGALYSDSLSFTVVPYSPPPAIAPPPNDSLYIVGAAVAADNWANPIPAADVAAETFKEVSPTEYTLTIALVGGQEYKLVNANNGSYNEQWSVASVDTYANGGPFVENGANCISPAASGNYLIDVNFQTGMFTVTLQ